MDICHPAIKYSDKMEIRIYTVVTNLGDAIQPKMQMITKLSNSLQSYFNDKFYGEDILSVSIGLILAKTIKGYEDWYKAKKPKYIQHEIKKSKLTGDTSEVQKMFQYEIKLNDIFLEKFSNSSIQESYSLLCNEILISLSSFDSLPKKIKDFDKKAFRADLEDYFKEQNLI
jgi:hypothetical protein